MKIDIKGPIVSNDDLWIYEWFEIDATSPGMVHDALKKANGSDVEVHINSGGGSVFDGSEIYTALKDYEGNVTVKIVGLAASAASVIAMAGDKVLMSPTSQMMIHNASVLAAGDYRDMEHTAEVLKNVNKTIANAYHIKSGLSDEELLELMNKETWFTPQQALDKGLIDEIMFDQNYQLVASFNSGVLPREVIEKVKNAKMNELLNKSSSNEDDFLFKNNLRKRKLNLLEVE